MNRGSVFGARLALRRLVRQPGFSVPVALTLALGIGASAAVFALVNGILIRPLPYREADRLVVIRHAASRIDLPMNGISPGAADYYRAHNRVFEEIGMYVEHVRTLSDLGDPERVQTALVTPGVFSVLRTATSAGRLIGPTDYEPPAGNVAGVVRGVLVSHDLWVRRYGADPSLIGRTIEIDRLRLRVVGIAEPGFHFPHAETQVWMAWGWPTAVASRASLSGLAYGSIARLKPGVSRADAERDLQRLVGTMPDAYLPNLYPPKADTITGVVHDYIPDDEVYVVRTQLPTAAIVSAIRRLIHEVDPKLAITQVGTLGELVAGSVARTRLTMLLLLVAAGTALCLGVIGIYGILSYAVSQRTSELGLRIALGASPRAVVRMVVRQGALLALAGIALGVVSALALTRYLRTLLYEVSPTDPVAFAAMAALLFAVALAASYVPARRAAKVDPMTALRSE